VYTFFTFIISFFIGNVYYQTILIIITISRGLIPVNAVGLQLLGLCVRIPQG